MKPLATEMTARGRGPRPIVTRGVVQCGPWRGPRPIVTRGVVQCGRGVVRGLLSHMAWYSGPVAWSAAYCHTWRGTVRPVAWSAAYCHMWRGTVRPWRGPRPIVTCGVVQWASGVVRGLLSHVAWYSAARGVVRGLLSHVAWYSGPVAWSAAYCHTWRGTVGPWRGPRPIVTCGVVQCGPWRGIRPIVTRYA